MYVRLPEDPFHKINLYTLLSNPCIWSRDGTPLCNGFALLILSIITLVFILKPTPALLLGGPGLIVYPLAKKLWKKWFG
jgi:hypothetical protein